MFNLKITRSNHVGHTTTTRAYKNVSTRLAEKNLLTRVLNTDTEVNADKRERDILRRDESLLRTLVLD